MWGYESQQDLASILHLALVDCAEYNRLGVGVTNCVIKSTAPYKYVVIRQILPTGALKASVRYTVGNKSYFSGYDSTRIISNDVFKLADEYYLEADSSVTAIPTVPVAAAAPNKPIVAPTLAPTLVPVAVGLPIGKRTGKPILYDPKGPDRDCMDFSTWNEAQDFYEAAGGPALDPHKLDGSDKDGIVCESLPGHQ